MVIHLGQIKHLAMRKAHLNAVTWNLTQTGASSTARVMLVVDRSYSMIEDDDRWSPMLAAIDKSSRGSIRPSVWARGVPEPTARSNVPADVAEACAPAELM